MAWIEVHQSLPTHAKTMDAAALLDVPEVEVVGHVVCLWLWGLDNAHDGRVPLDKPHLLARAARWTGEPGRFVDALVAAGFVDAGGTLHDWDEYTGRLMERRERVQAQTRQRVQAYRDRHRMPIFNRDRGHCRYCHREVTPATSAVDHIDPGLKGGRSGDDNLALSCVPCNAKKGGRSPEDAGMVLLSIWEPVTPEVTRYSAGSNAPVTLGNAPTVPHRTVPPLSPPSPPPVPAPEKEIPPSLRSGGAPAVPAVRAVPKPNRVAAFVDAVVALGVEAPAISARDGRALKDCSRPPEVLAAAYAAAWRGEWGDDWFRENLSPALVVARIAGYEASLRGPPAAPRARRNGRSNYLTDSLAPRLAALKRLEAEGAEPIPLTSSRTARLARLARLAQTPGRNDVRGGPGPADGGVQERGGGPGG